MWRTILFIVLLGGITVAQETTVATKIVARQGTDDITPMVSSDGQSIFFASYNSFDNTMDIWKVKLKGGSSAFIRVTSGGDFSMSPKWFNGTILFDSDRGGTTELWSKRENGSPNVTHYIGYPQTSSFAASWSPDGTRIAYTFVGETINNWWLHYLTPPQIEVAKEMSIWTVGIDHSSPTQLGPGAFPSWSPTGNLIAYAAYNNSWDIWTMTPNGSNQSQITSDEEDELYPAFSPDGKWIAYAKWSLPFNTADIWVRNINGSQIIQLTHTPHITESCPYWVRNGKTGSYIYFQSDQSNEYDIWRIDPRITMEIASSDPPTLPPPLPHRSSNSNVKNSSNFSIVILNSTKLTGEARRMASLLRRKGYSASASYDRPVENLKNGLIYYKQGYKSKAMVIARLIPGVQYIKPASSDRRFASRPEAITVVLGWH